jgi:hypothetical protein
VLKGLFGGNFYDGLEEHKKVCSFVFALCPLSFVLCPLPFALSLVSFLS